MVFPSKQVLCISCIYIQYTYTVGKYLTGCAVQANCPQPPVHMVPPPCSWPAILVPRRLLPTCWGGHGVGEEEGKLHLLSDTFVHNILRLTTLGKRTGQSPLTVNLACTVGRPCLHWWDILPSLQKVQLPFLAKIGFDYLQKELWCPSVTGLSLWGVCS